METAGSTDFYVNRLDPVMVAPALSLPKATLELSVMDNREDFRAFFNSLLVYSAPDSMTTDPAKIIREALSKVLVHYFPVAGRFRNKENGDLQVECTGEGALFVEATVENSIAVLRDLDDLNPSFQRLVFWHPSDSDNEEVPLLVLQVTRFTCGGISIGLTFSHSLFDGRGAAQFVIAFAEMARGEINPSLEPAWNRELLKPEDLVDLQLHQFDSICPPPILFEELGQASLTINSDIIKYMKQCVVAECKKICTTFEVIAALIWIVRTKAFQIPHSENVKLIYPMDIRKSFNPPFPNGYYGNATGNAYAVDKVEDLLNGSLSRVVMIIKKSKAFLSDNFSRSSKEMDSCALDVNKKHKNVLALSDWRHLGFHEADFGWGDPLNVSCLQALGKGLPMFCYFLFLRPPKNKPDGIKILLSCMPPSRVKSIKIEMEAIINKYMAKS